jgi:hypothetical protein
MPKQAKLDSEISLANYLNANFPLTTKRKFTQNQKDKLRPIAETLAMLDGNAFFGISINEDGEDSWYEQYLPEAWRIYKANGGDKGWASEVSWIKEANHENDSVKEAWQEWQLLKELSKNSK